MPILIPRSSNDTSDDSIHGSHLNAWRAMSVRPKTNAAADLSPSSGGGNNNNKRRGISSRAPPPIDLQAELAKAQAQEDAVKPAWQPKKLEKSAAAPVVMPQKLNFSKPQGETGGPQKTAMQIALERKRAKKEAEEQARKEAEEKEKNKYAGLPEWKRRMFEKKDADKEKAKQPEKDLERRRKELEDKYSDLPGWQKERKIKAEKKRILQEEGIIL